MSWDLWSCPLDRWLAALAQGWRLSLAPLVPSYEGTGHARFAVLMWRPADEERDTGVTA